MPKNEPFWSIEKDDGTLFVLSEQNGITVTDYNGVGMPPLENVSTPYGLRDGRFFQRTRVFPRTIILSLTIGSSSGRIFLFSLRKALLESINPHLQQSPWKLRYHYTNGSVRYINVLYDAGFEFIDENAGQEDVALRFIAFDPYWYGSLVQGTQTGVFDEIEVNYIMSRPSLGGGWDNMNAGANSYITDIVEAPDGTIYACGNFTSIGGVAANRIAKWDGSTWSPLGTGSTGRVNAMAVNANGILFAGATGTLGATGSSFAFWEAGTWSAIGAPPNNSVYAVTLSVDGNIYIGGSFTLVDGVAADRIAYFGVGGWNALGGGVDNGVVRTIAVTLAQDVYVGGNFTTVDGIACANLAKWNGTAWVNIGDTNGEVNALLTMPNNNVVVGGVFTSISGVDHGGIAEWNGTTFLSFDDWETAGIYSLAIDNDGFLYAGGMFRSYGGVLASTVRRWVGDRWNVVDLGEEFGGNHVYAIAFVRTSDAMYIGGDFVSPSLQVPKIVTITYQGTAKAYPIFIFTGPMHLLSLINARTKQGIYFYLWLGDGEQLTVDLSNGVKTVTSNWRGNMLGSVFYGNLVDFHLLPGDNDINVYGDRAFASQIYSFLPQYWSLD